MNFTQIINTLNKAILSESVVDIYYSQTDNSPEGWRSIVPRSITTDIPPEGETLVPGRDRMSPGHILNATDVDSNLKEEKSFIIGKIKKVRT